MQTQLRLEFSDLTVCRYSYRRELFCKAQQRRVCSRNASDQKGGRRSLMNGITYGSLTEAMEAAVRNVIHDCVVSREVKNLQEVLAKAQLLKEEISANVQILNAHFPPKTLPKSEVPPTEPPVTPSGKEV